MSKVNAAGIALSVSPSIIQMEAIPPADVRAPITIENKSEDTINVRIIFNLFKPTNQENGTFEYLGENDVFPGSDKDILHKVQVIDNGYSVDSVTLGPKQKKKLVLRVAIPKKEPYSDYYFSVIFLAEPTYENQAGEGEEENNLSIARGGIATNVLLSVGPKGDAKGTIEQFSAPLYLEQGPVPFTVRVKNTGSHFITPKGVILVKNMFGQTVGRVDIASSNILSGTTRALFDIDSKDTALTRPKAVWREKFLLGYYSATLSIALSDKGPIYTKSLNFIALPVTLLVGIVIAISLILIIYVRIKSRLAQ